MTRYLIISPHTVLDRDPGSVFDDELDPVLEQRLILGRHLRIIPPEPVVADVVTTSEPGDHDEEDSGWA